MGKHLGSVYWRVRHRQRNHVGAKICSVPWYIGRKELFWEDVGKNLKFPCSLRKNYTCYTPVLKVDLQLDINPFMTVVVKSGYRKFSVIWDTF